MALMCDFLWRQRAGLEDCLVTQQTASSRKKNHREPNDHLHSHILKHDRERQRSALLEPHQDLHPGM